MDLFIQLCIHFQRTSLDDLEMFEILCLNVNALAPANEFPHELDFWFVIEVTALISPLFLTTGQISAAK